MVMGACAIFPVYEWGLKDYQKGRIDGFLKQLPFAGGGKGADDVTGQGYQVFHSKVAVGSGGFFGVGIGEGEANALQRVPERHNDFIFAVVAHELGLAGSLIVLLLFGWLLLGILAVGMRHRDPAGRLICIGIFALFGFQAFINVAMTVGLMPITGLTLPFLSYGRSSLVVSIVAVALVCNVAARPSYEFGRGDFD
jgi:rod shape determining protein RodA